MICGVARNSWLALDRDEEAFDYHLYHPRKIEIDMGGKQEMSKPAGVLTGGGPHVQKSGH